MKSTNGLCGAVNSGEANEIMNSPVVFIMGPTASGKTDVAVALYESLNCELISVDAAQVYKGMNIGTAKPDADFLLEFPHHLIDIRDIDQPYSAAEFRLDALRLIDEIQARGKVPVFVGGTMFYYAALENGISDLPASDPTVRADLEQQLSERGAQSLHGELRQIDPELCRKIQPADIQRVMRGLEIYKITGQVPSDVMRRSQLPGLSTQPVKISLFTVNRHALHRRIESRFKKMIASGFVDEVRALVAPYPNPDKLTSMKSVGYRQVLGFLRDQASLDQMVDSGVAATRQLAKRQLTWLRNQSNITWFEANPENVSGTVIQYLDSRLPSSPVI